MKKIWNKFKNWKYHEEIIAISILLFIFYICNLIFTIMFPNSAFFDFVSQIETIINNIVTFVVAISVANISIWIIFPNIYHFLRKNFYDFNDICIEDKYKYSIYILITFIIASALIF